MSWKYREPLRSDYDSDEDYEDARDRYDSACDDYIERYREKRRVSRRHRED